MSLITDIKECEIAYARANQHSMSCWERCVDTAHSCCIDCGAETVLTLENNTVSFIRHEGTQFICPTPHPTNPFWDHEGR